MFIYYILFIFHQIVLKKSIKIIKKNTLLLAWPVVVNNYNTIFAFTGKSLF